MTSLPLTITTPLTSCLLPKKDGWFAAEEEEGAVEYKWRLTNVSGARRTRLTTQMQFRVTEGAGQARYLIGVADDGAPQGIDEQELTETFTNLYQMAEHLQLDLKLTNRYIVGMLRPGDEFGAVCSVSTSEVKPLFVAQVLVTQRPPRWQDLRIAVCGAEGVGKSTLVSLLTTGSIDNGHGTARQSVFNFKHEFQTGQTSSISRRVVGFDELGGVTNYRVTRPTELQETLQPPLETPLCRANSQANAGSDGNRTWTIAKRSVKLVTLMDLSGSLRYAKSAYFGITSRTPGFLCVVVESTAPKSVQKYLTLCRMLNLACFVVVTKLDLLNALEIYELCIDLCNIISLFKVKPVIVEEGGHSVLDGTNGVAAASVAGETVPVFLLSCTTGRGVCPLVHFLSLLPSQERDTRALTEILLDGHCLRADCGGCVVSGFVLKGVVSAQSVLWLGPDRQGQFYMVAVGGVHIDGNYVAWAPAGRDVTILLYCAPWSVDLSRKGTVLRGVESEVPPVAVLQFDCTLRILMRGDGWPHVNEEPIVHCRNIRQAARLLSIFAPAAPEDARLSCRFIYHPEVLAIGDRILLRYHSEAKYIGIVSNIVERSLTVAPPRMPKTHQTRGAFQTWSLASDPMLHTELRYRRWTR